MGSWTKRWAKIPNISLAFDIFHINEQQCEGRVISVSKTESEYVDLISLIS